MQIRRRVAVLALTLAACAGHGGRDALAVSGEEWLTLRTAELVPALRVSDAIAAREDPSAAAWLLPILRDPDAGHELRAGVAASLLRLGHGEGQDFCIAVLRANLAEAAESDARYGLPRSDRWAFARELAYEALAERLRAAGATPPPFDVNFGAPDLLRAAAECEARLARLPRPTLGLGPEEMAARLPIAPPPGWDVADYERWTRIREELVRDAAREQGR